MPLTSQQLDTIMSKSGQAFVPRDRMNYAGRVCETYLRKKLYRFEDRAALAVYGLLQQVTRDIRDYALWTSSNLGIDTVANDSKSIVFRRAVGNYATQRLIEFGKQAAVLGYRYAVISYAAGWYGRLWMLHEASHGDKRVKPTRVPMGKAAQAVLQPGITEAVQPDFAAYDNLGDEWRDMFTGAISNSITKVKRVLSSSVSEPLAVLAVVNAVSMALGTDVPAKQPAKALYHAVQLPIRTAVMRSANHASVEVYKTHTEMLLGVMLVTSHDDRVCSICAPLDGKIFVVNSLVGIALFGLPPDSTHYGCRCMVIPLLLPVDSPNDPPQDDMEDWLNEWGFGDDLDFFMDDKQLKSTQV